jgi:hypothetical protein
VDDPVANPPVANVNMDTTGRFAFVEFQSEEMATKALEMDKVVRGAGEAWGLAGAAARRPGGCSGSGGVAGSRWAGVGC